MLTFAYRLTVCAVALVMSATPGFAQKSKDTFRQLHAQAIATLDPYLDPRPEVYFASEMPFDRLIMLDEGAEKFVGNLARSWARPDTKTIEMELRDDVTWSDGQKFTADDVIYTLGYLSNPKSNFRFASDYDWIERVEKLGPHKIRIVASRTVPYDLARLGGYTFMFPQHVHGPLESKQDFGRAPVGTGPYKIVQVDKNTGIRAEKRTDHVHANNVKKSPSIKNVVLRGVPDRGTRVAELLAGNVDAIHDVSPDQAEDLAKSPQLAMTVTLPFAYQYMMIDMKGRSGVAPLKDRRVRAAILHAIDPEAINIMIGGKSVSLTRPPALCHPMQLGCDYSLETPKFDRAKARGLLAEAGVPSGFDVAITTNSLAGKDIAEVVAGQLRAIGIRANVDPQTFAAYRQLQSDGKINIMISGWGGGGLPDVGGTLDFLFEGGSRDYHGVPGWVEAAQKANTENDDRARRAIVKKLFDEVTTEGYIVPMAPIPRFWMHTREVKIATPSSFNAYGADAWGFSWQ